MADAIRFVSSGVSAPGINYVHADHLGAPQKMTDANQALVWDAVYTPFGQVHSITGTATNNQRFPGQYADAETGFNYNYFRDYDPTTGRYVQSDPIGLQGGLNPYAYVKINPLKYFDFYGTIESSSPFGDLLEAINDLINEGLKLGGNPRRWGKHPNKVGGGRYSCRYVIAVFTPQVCPTPDCPVFATGEGVDFDLDVAARLARMDAQDKIPPGCGHQHHGQTWCRKGNQKPFLYTKGGRR